MQMSPAQFSALFEGLDWRLVRPGAGAAAGARGMSLRQSDSGPPFGHGIRRSHVL